MPTQPTNHDPYDLLHAPIDYDRFYDLINRLTPDYSLWEGIHDECCAGHDWDHCPRNPTFGAGVAAAEPDPG